VGLVGDHIHVGGGAQEAVDVDRDAADGHVVDATAVECLEDDSGVERDMVGRLSHP
jgi:hypothetical protein